MSVTEPITTDLICETWNKIKTQNHTNLVETSSPFFHKHAFKISIDASKFLRSDGKIPTSRLPTHSTKDLNTYLVKVAELNKYVKNNANNDCIKVVKTTKNLSLNIFNSDIHDDACQTTVLANIYILHYSFYFSNITEFLKFYSQFEKSHLHVFSKIYMPTNKDHFDLLMNNTKRNCNHTVLSNSKLFYDKFKYSITFYINRWDDDRPSYNRSVNINFNRFIRDKIIPLFESIYSAADSNKMSDSRIVFYEKFSYRNSRARYFPIIDDIKYFWSIHMNTKDMSSPAREKFINRLLEQFMQEKKYRSSSFNITINPIRMTIYTNDDQLLTTSLLGMFDDYAFVKIREIIPISSNRLSTNMKTTKC